MAKIKKIIGREVLDSRGYPTVEAIVQLDDGAVGSFAAPSGSSIGRHEAVELRDGDIKRYGGKGVLKCLHNILYVLAPRIIGKDAANQVEIDKEMIQADGTSDKSRLGANTILAISAAVAKAQSASEHSTVYKYISKLLSGTASEKFEIPTIMFNILNGGKHGGGNTDFQEFMIVPPQATSYSSNLRVGSEIYYALKEVIANHSGITLIGDEGGYAPVLYTNADALKIIEESIQKAGYSLGMDVFFSLDIAASYFMEGNSYKIKDRPVALSTNDFIDYFATLNEQYHILSLEDPLSEDDWDGWALITQKLGSKTLIVGDDLITTNLARLNKAIEKKSCNAIVVKPNQVGTITETLEVVKRAKEANFKIVVSHRSGETNEDFIADFAVGINADYAKFGAPARGERVAKYNRLLEIEYELS
ncbi:MAG: phosphopyruvate hydratase [Patescibacteria group bacterium]